MIIAAMFARAGGHELLASNIQKIEAVGVRHAEGDEHGGEDGAATKFHAYLPGTSPLLMENHNGCGCPAVINRSRRFN
jgi:hypothetical protein